MNVGVVDSLKSRAFGEKKDVLQKQAHIDRVSHDPRRQYYPVDPKSNGTNIDEWGAIIQQQSQAYKAQEEREAKERA